MARSFILRTPTGNVVMQETAYSTEDLFQAMLANTSEVLSGDQINPSVPRRWLLISREMPVPDSNIGANRWSLDHLFLDQDGIPTLVEVKRSTDSRLRREVVGQMLDYAANAVVYWPADIIQERLAAQSLAKGQTVEAVLSDFLGHELDDEAAANRFWEKVHLNLRAGKVRMLFVADHIPPELQRIIEFLNEQMSPAEVLGVEVRLHTGGKGYELLIPSVIGRTADAQAAKTTSTGQRRLWDEDSYYADMAVRLGDRAIETVHAIADWMQRNDVQAQFGGQGKTYGSLVGVYYFNGTNHRPIVIYGDGSVEIRLNHMKETAPFDQVEKRLDLLRRLNHIPGVNLPESKIDSRPNFRIERLSAQANLDHFLDVFSWYLNEVQSQG